MIKSYSSIILILIALFSYGQEITFQKNVGSAARKLLLVQQLNKSGDSLILESEKKKIRQVDILNEDYLESIEVDSVKGRINLKKVPAGNYVIQARIGSHWIVMYMEKRNHSIAGLKTTDVKINAELNSIALKSESLKESTLSTKQNKQTVTLDENTMYWVVYESNSQFSSKKTMGLKYADEIVDMIERTKLEIKSEVGKYNKLFVYEIYNKSKFMSKQLRNRKYYKKKKSKLFNVLPVYNSDYEKINNSQS